MNLRRWGLFGALLGAVLVGCDESAVDEVEDERGDVLEAQQELNEEQAELRQAEQEAQTESADAVEGPVLTDPTVATPAVPPTTPTTDLPTEGDPQPGTADVGATPAPEDDVNLTDEPAEVEGESDSEGQEIAPTEPEPASPQ